VGADGEPVLGTKSTVVLVVAAGALLSACSVPLSRPAAAGGSAPLATCSRAGTEAEHLSIAKHFTAEKKVEEFVAGRGVVTRWVAVSRNNHWLDAVELAKIMVSSGVTCWTTFADRIALRLMLLWVSSAPLGRPVVPDVNNRSHTSSGEIASARDAAASIGTSLARPRNACHDVVPLALPRSNTISSRSGGSSAPRSNAT